MKNSFRRCELSVMDNIADPNITFDDNGVCNYYHEYIKMSESNLIADPETKQEQLKKIVENLKNSGKKKPYDCIIGVSGGVDSTYLAYIAGQLNLRVLTVHFDNGWNSELAVKNIENICSKLNFDLFTYVVDWDEFKDVQLAYLKASVVDIEAITDHAINAVLLKTASKHGIKHILSGTNIVTEATLPSYWIYNKGDARNIKDIHKNYGSLTLKTFPFCDVWERKYYRIKGITSIALLDYVDYKKDKAKEIISNELGWRDYGGKHYESIFTRFYQGYILPTKFSIDKRKAHLSNLIFSGQMTREEALRELEKPMYPEEQFQVDKEFVLKKLELNELEFDEIMKSPRREHTEFEIERSFFDKYPAFKILEPIWAKIRPI